MAEIAGVARCSGMEQTAPDQNPFANILVVIDPTAQRQHCLDKAIQVARRAGSTLELFICDTPESAAETRPLAGEVMEHRRQLAVQRLEKLEALAAPMRAAGLRVSTHAAWDSDLSTGIGMRALRSGANLVIKETHRHLPMPHAMQSLTDSKLIHQLPCALLLTRPTPWPQKPVVSIAIDPCQPAERTVALDRELLVTGAALATSMDATVDVVHVLRSPPHLPGEAVPSDVIARAAEQSRERVMDVVRDSGVVAPLYFETGLVASNLVSFTSEYLSDVLVMGSTARPRWMNGSAGGTAAEILEHLTCDLLVLKPPGFVSDLLVSD